MRLSLIKQSLFANAGYLMGVEIINSVVGFLFWGLAARLYSPKDVGIATAIFSAVILISGIAEMGLGIGLVRYLPESRHPHRLLNTIFVFNILITIIIGGIYLAGLTIWSPSLLALRQNVFWAAAFLTYCTLMTLTTMIRMTFVAYRQAKYALIQTTISNFGRLILLLILVGYGALGVIGSIALAVLATVGFSLFGLLPRVNNGYRPRFEINWSELSRLLPYSLGNHIAGFLAQLPRRIMPLMILEMLGAEASGYTYIAWMFSNLILVPGIALAGSALAEGSNSPQNSSIILTKTTVIGFLLTVPASIFLWFVAPVFLALVGISYVQESTGLLRWLAIATPLVLLTWLFFTHLRIQKRIGVLILLSSIITIITLSTATILMPYYGIDATGMGWAFGNGLVAIISVISIVKNSRNIKVMATIKNTFYINQDTYENQEADNLAMSQSSG